MGKLPFERRDTKILIKQKAETSPKYGMTPDKRSVEELIHSGIVVIDKPDGPSSHQVSAYVKQIFKLDAAGHSGTLDPGVTGVLPVALGNGTRIVQSLLPAGKEYICLMHVHKEVSEEQLRSTIASFVGKIKQMPPIKSAVKRQWRIRKVYYIEILGIQGQEVLFVIGCQAGTYIRKLCLSPDTEILTSTGLRKANEFYDAPGKIYTRKEGRIEQARPSAVQKLLSPEQLIKITTESGVHFIVTKDHEMLTSTTAGYKMKEAKELKIGDYLVKSCEFPAIAKKYVVADLLDDGFLIDQPEIREQCKQAFLKKYGSIREMHQKVQLDRKSFLKNSVIAISIKHLKLAGIYEQVKEKLRRFKTANGNVITCDHISEDLAYILGLIASDGNNTKEKGTVRHTRIKFHNKDAQILKVYMDKYKRLFPTVPLSLKEVSPKFYQVDSSNAFLATLAASLGVSSPHPQHDILPILSFDEKNLRAFLRGYFDGDGSAYFKKKTLTTGQHSRIDITSVSYTNAKRLHTMLLKLGISNKIFKTAAYIVVINSPDAKRKFIEQIGTEHPWKKKKLQELQVLKRTNHDSRHIGLHYKAYLTPSALHALGGNVGRVIKGSMPLTRSFYQTASTLTKIPALDDFCIEKIRKIEIVQSSGFVYDLTVPDTHNFLIETGFVSSNCHDIGTALGVGAHMGELRRTKAAAFGESDLATLQDVADAYHYFKEEKNEAPLRKILKPLEAGVAHLGKIWVLDTTVESLCQGMQLKTPGIAQLDNDIQAEDLVAVLTLKGELILVGQALMPSKSMMGEKGIAVKTQQVFLKPGTYPKPEKK